MFKKNSKVRDLLDVALLLLLVLTMYIFPSFALIITILSNVLMCVITYRSNVVKSIGCIISTYAFMVIFGFLGNAFSLSHLLDCAISTLNFLLMGFSIGIMLKLTGEISRILISGGASYLAIIVLEIMRYNANYETSVMDVLVNNPVKDFLKYYEQVVAASGFDFVEMFGASIEDVIWALQQSLAMIVPALLILTSVAYAFIIFVISRKILAAYKVKLYTKTFSEYQMPAASSLALVASYLITMFSTSTLGAACANILIILTTLYVICGFSVIEYKFKAKMSITIFRIIIYIIVFLISMFVTAIIPFFNIITILMIIGMFDGVYDFRKLKKEEINEEE